jgi:hypothetical protein
MLLPLLFLLFLLPFAFPASAAIVNSTGSTWNVTASFADKVYVDVLPSPSVNPDFAMKLCDVGQKFVAAVYAANSSGTAIYTSVSKNLTSGSSATLVYTTLGAGPCYTTPTDSFAFSQFRDFARSPNVFVSAFPGRLHALYSGTSDGASPSFVFMNYSGGWLMGSYSTTQSFSESTNNVTANIASISFVTDAGTVSKAPSDSDWGISSSTGRSLVIALCSDDYGGNCSDMRLLNSSSELPAQLALHQTVSDAVTYRRYFVVNGLGYGPLCMGADLAPSISFGTNPISAGGNSTVNVTITNNGNVQVTTNFRLTLNITGPGGFSNQTNWTITETIPAGGSTSRAFTFLNTSRSGTYTFTAESDSLGDIAECDENNVVTDSLTVQAVYLMHVLIDGNETNIFPYAGQPYNVTVYVSDSDGNNVTNPYFLFTETNGLNLFTPTQLWNDSGKLYNLSSTVTGQMRGNGSGVAMLAVVPTCNKLYDDPAKNATLLAAIGNYSMKLNAYNSGHAIISVFYAGSYVTDYPLYVANSSCADPGWLNNKELVNKEYVMPVYDWVYQVFAILKKLLVP